jgi:hypothetical protein
LHFPIEGRLTRRRPEFWRRHHVLQKRFPNSLLVEGPMNKLLRDPFTLIAALTVVVLGVEIVAARWL